MIHQPRPTPTGRRRTRRPPTSRRRVRAVSLLLGATVVAGACSGGSGTTSTASSAEGTSGASSEATPLAAPAGSKPAPGAVTDADPASGLTGSVIVLGVPADAYPPTVGELIGIDPANAGFDVLNATADLLWDSLTAVDADGSAKPAAAHSWAMSDPTTWVFRLDPAARYHDGSPVLAADFVNGINRFSGHPEFMLHYLGEPIAGWGTDAPGVRAVDDHTLEIRTSAPAPLLPEIVANVAFSPRPVRSAGDAIPPQNGPYQVVSQRGLTVVTERNSRHNGGRAGADHVVIRLFDSHDAWVDAMDDGTIDVAFITRAEIDALSLRPDRIAQAGTDAIAFIELDQSDPTLAKPEVRQALSMAIDREALLPGGLPGERAAKGYVPESWPGARADACVACTFDPEGARRKLADAGIDPRTITIEVGAYHEARIELIADMWRKNLGITVEVDNEGSDPASVDAVLAGWYPDYPDAASYLAAALARHYAPVSPPTAELLERSVTTPDPAARLEVLGQAQLALAAEMLNIPLAFAAFPAFVSERIATLPFDGLGVPMLGSVTLRSA